MFVPVVVGSDKTIVSVMTGHQEYHPVYMSPGNLTNIARRAQGDAVLPVAFLPIPKSMFFCSFWCMLLICSCSVEKTSGHKDISKFLPANVSCGSGSHL